MLIKKIITEKIYKLFKKKKKLENTNSKILISYSLISQLKRINYKSFSKNVDFQIDMLYISII